MKIAYILFALSLILATATTTEALLDVNASDISYLVNNSDRIIIGTITDIQPFYDHTIVTIGVDEWLMNPLPTEAITIRTKIGTDFWTEDEPTFVLNETIILMLEDVNIDEDRFRVVFGEPGKHPVSDRDAVLQELDTREQAQIEYDSDMNKVPVNDAPANRIPFIGVTSSLMILIGAVLLAHYKKYI